ncbi:MAG: hypothetical protein HXX81_07335 [Campylobacterales bacterium]|nr:hypothetical protein [Campylobacterales bacterium]
MKNIEISLNGKRLNIELSEEVADFMIDIINSDFSIKHKTINDKELLEAYLKRIQELSIYKFELERLLEKIC